MNITVRAKEKMSDLVVMIKLDILLPRSPWFWYFVVISWIPSSGDRYSTVQPWKSGGSFSSLADPKSQIFRKRCPAHFLMQMFSAISKIYSKIYNIPFEGSEVK